MSITEILFFVFLADLIGVSVLVFSFLFLWYQYPNKKFFAYWSLSWLLYMGRVIAAIFLLSSPRSLFLLFVSFDLVVWSAFFLLCGILLFTKRAIHRYYWIIPFVATIWIVVGLLMANMNPEVFRSQIQLTSFPIYIFLGVMYGLNGLIFLRLNSDYGKARYFCGLFFFAWAVQKIFFVWLRTFSVLLPYLYTYDLAMELFIAFCLLVIYFQKEHHETVKMQLETTTQKSNFIQLATHELKSPLAVLEGFFGIMSNDKGKYTPDERRKLLELGHISVTRLNTLVSQLGDMYRIDQGFLNPEKKPFNFAKFIGNVVQPYLLLHPDQVVFDQQDLDLWFNGDETKLEHVVNNLIQNAIKHTDPKTRLISIRTEAEEGKDLRLIIQDNGVGIPVNRQKEIFKPFQSFGSRYASKSLGVGLYIAKTIVESHEGTIEVNSRGEETGTTFVITFPPHTWGTEEGKLKAE